MITLIATHRYHKLLFGIPGFLLFGALFYIARADVPLWDKPWTTALAPAARITYDVASDSIGNTYTIDYFGILFKQGPGSTDANPLWQQSLGYTGIGSLWMNSSQTNIYVAGRGVSSLMGVSFYDTSGSYIDGYAFINGDQFTVYPIGVLNNVVRDSTGSYYVVGVGGLSGNAWVVAKYPWNGGNYLWVDDGGVNDEQAVDAAVDSAGNIYVVGNDSTLCNLLIKKYTPSSSSPVNTKTYTRSQFAPTSGDTCFNNTSTFLGWMDIEIAPSGKIFVNTAGTGSGKHVVIIQFDANLNVVTHNVLADGTNKLDPARRMKIDSSDIVYIGGMSSDSSSNGKSFLAKLNGAAAGLPLLEPMTFTTATAVGAFGGGGIALGETPTVRYQATQMWNTAAAKKYYRMIKYGLNTAPSANNQSVSTAYQTPINITLGGGDADGCVQSFTFTVTTQPANGSVSPVSGAATCSGGNLTASVTYTPNAGFSGSNSFTFKFNDSIADSNSATVSVTVNVVAPTVISPTATSITTTSATLGANVTSNGGAALTARGTCWGTSPSPTTNCLAEGGTSTGIFSHSRTSMPSNTLIYYRGYATNSAGTGYSSDGSFTTGVAVSVPTVTSPTATSITTTSATLGANVTSNGGAALTARGTCWGTSPSPSTNCLAEGGIATGVFSHSRTGLPSGTLIYYRGYATNSAGSGYSLDGSFTTNTAGGLSVSPSSGPTAGGTSVTITGSGFSNGTVGLWHMNETSDTNVADSSGNSNNGTASSASSAGATGVFASQARSFNGTNDIVTVPIATSPTVYTITAWVKPSLVGSGSIVVRTSSCGPTCAWSHQLRLTSAGKFEHYTYDGGLKSVIGSTIVVPGQWYFVVGTAQNGGIMRLYVNGNEEGTPVSLGTLWTGGDRYIIGSNSGGSINYFNGIIDETRIYKRVLTQDEITALKTNIEFPTSIRSRFDTSDAASVVFNNSTQLSALTPAHAAGPVNVSVTNFDNTSASCANCFTYLGTNSAPTANAGINQTITLPASATLSGSASDDGLPNPPAALTYKWSNVSGPGTVTFGDNTALSTTASFSVAGTYVLHLNAYDGALNSAASPSGDVTITVNAAVGGLSVTSVSPSSGPTTGGTAVTITGSGFSNGTVGMWHFDEVSGNAVDSSGNGRTAIPTGTTVVSGNPGFGNARSFAVAGSDNMSFSSVNLGASHTVMAWVQFPIPLNANWRTLFARNGGSYHYILVEAGTNRLGFFNNGFNYSGLDVSTVPVGWHHLAAVGTGGTTKFYLDGIQVGSTVASQISGQNVGVIGNYLSSGGNQGWGTAVDDPRVYTRALSVSEISAIATSNTDSIMTASFGGADVTNLIFMSSTQLFALTPPNAAGNVVVSVNNFDGQSAICSASPCFTYEEPAPLFQCSDGIDNDGDGKIDFGAGPTNDSGCTDPSDDSEGSDNIILSANPILLTATVIGGSSALATSSATFITVTPQPGLPAGAQVTLMLDKPASHAVAQTLTPRFIKSGAITPEVTLTFTNPTVPQSVVFRLGVPHNTALDIYESMVIRAKDTDKKTNVKLRVQDPAGNTGER